uniref:Uncharacterized protein n=1 Tax=Anser cygnoides TaxID=8845 RepID=A0A8B9D798_ANSCY
RAGHRQPGEGHVPDQRRAARDVRGRSLCPQEVNQRLMNLYALLHGLQAVVSQQDTLLELRLQEGAERREKPPAAAPPSSTETARPGERPSSELALLQRQHALLQEELARCRQLCHERAQEAAGLEGRLRGSEQERARLERERDEAQRQLAALRQEAGGARGRRGTDPRRRTSPPCR